MWTLTLLRGVLLSAVIGAALPSGLAAQSVYHTVAGVRRALPARSEMPLALSPQGAEPSLGVHLLMGTVVGGALGAALAVATSDCESSLFNQVCDASVALQGALVGAVGGALVGIFVWQGKKSPPALNGAAPLAHHRLTSPTMP